MSQNVQTNERSTMLESKYPAGALVVVDIPERTVPITDNHGIVHQRGVPRYHGPARVQSRAPGSTWNGGMCWVVLDDGWDTRVICHAHEVVGVA